MEISSSDQKIGIRDDLLGHKVTRRMISDFLADPEETELALEAKQSHEPDPHERILKGLVLRKTSGPVLLEVATGYLVATGSTESLERFCSFFSFDWENKNGDQYHFEPIEGDAFTHPESRSAVISLKM